MLMEIEKCSGCGRLFTFDTTQCSQVILRQYEIDASIIFMPCCPFCNHMNMLELPWDKYNNIDY